MKLQFGEISDNTLEIRFSTADYSIATVMNAIREHVDVLQEFGVKFMGAATDVHTGSTPVFQPVDIKAVFVYTGEDSCTDCLERVYTIIWHGVVQTFPDETDWANAKEAFGNFVIAQADLLRARREQ